MFPKLWFLGPLRWWIPWVLQAFLAVVATWMGRKPLMQKYMTKQDWEDERVQERSGGSSLSMRRKTKAV